MADRLTQLQDVVNLQAENFCNSIGILQQFAKPSVFPEFEKTKPPSVNGSSANNNGNAGNGTLLANNTASTSVAATPGTGPDGEDYAQLFATLIVRTAKDIDLLIDSLPSEESTPELQASHLRKLEADNQEASQRLEETVKKGERLLEQIQRSLQDIAEAQLKMQCFEPGQAS